MSVNQYMTICCRKPLQTLNTARYIQDIKCKSSSKVLLKLKSVPFFNPNDDEFFSTTIPHRRWPNDDEIHFIGLYSGMKQRISLFSRYLEQAFRAKMMIYYCGSHHPCDLGCDSLINVVTSNFINAFIMRLSVYHRFTYMG